MLRIRLQRVGRKNIPAFRIVLTDSKNSTKSGRYKEILGSFDPVNKTKAIKVDRVKHWMSVGAKPTDTLHNLLITEKIITGKKINVLPRKSPIKKEEKPVEGGAPVAATPVAEAKPAEAPTEVKPEEGKA
ncbi:MAG TPA: 30S ribosomal protein S16 [Candidatus Paceibacterota bacterium]